ncbi:MAG: hypothetical protein CCU26_10000 [Nitrospira sp. UW-LDO-01]|nr:hypothetical protein [Nitrospira sp.]OYT19745.1 MAG: hypothetical protein CCU26_10000 [Nitrospira sp. UW-LDO-01]
MEKRPAKDNAPKATTESVKLRGQFRSLVIGNPNYFGNLPNSPFQAVQKIVSDKTYEEIGCVGFHPQLERLHAVVYVKQTNGYGGGVCSDGTPEYVRFFLSFDNGATWQDQGLASFTAYDIPENKNRIEYAVMRRISPPRKFCFQHNLIRCRAILSWNVVPPPDPNFTPVWGEVHNTHIEVEGFKLFPLKDLFEAVKVKVPHEVGLTLDLDQPIPASSPTQLSVKQLAKLYNGKEVEPHRFALAELHHAITQAGSTDMLMAKGFKSSLLDLGIDFSKINALLFPTDGSVFYEELECVGYDTNQDTLVGVIRVKKPNGYSGGPCTAGSTEYVTFWGDVDGNGTFETCLGTASVKVNDFAEIPAEGLEYSVFLKADLAKYRQPCDKGARLVRIRAILSWQVPPPCANPNYIPVWGNREETVVHILPGDVIHGQYPILSSVGDIAVSDINSGGFASGVGIETGFLAQNSPFGGFVNLCGKIVGGTAATKYRVLIKPHGAPDSSYVPLTNEPTGLRLTLVTFPPLIINTNHIVHADAIGYYPYEDYASDHFIDGNVLMRWFTGPAEDGKAFDLRLDLSTDGDPAHDIHGNVVTVHVDNKDPDVDLKIDLGVGGECADFSLGTTFTGTYKAQDDHFHSFTFVVEPTGPANGVLPTPPSGTSVFAGGTITDPGVPSGTYTFNTAGMKPCGYALILHVWDRTNVNSGTNRNYNKDSVGFCLKG